MNTCHYRNVTSLILSIYTDKARANWCKTFRVLCKTGYLSRFIIHNDATIEFVDCDQTILLRQSNDRRNLHKSCEKFKLPSNVVLSLKNPFYNRVMFYIVIFLLLHRYVFTLDYASQELCISLQFLQTDCNGTLRKKNAVPTDFLNWKLMKVEPPKSKLCKYITII